MTSRDAYYNENDEFAAAWLRNLIAARLIAPGEVDTRSIVDVRGDDLAGFGQCHFFAGIGVWSYALRLAGWCDDRPVWTGSCPCGPFSGAGKKLAFDDPRHLWPEFFRLIRERRPRVVIGEQVASPPGLAWFDLVQSDMEGEGYPCAAIDLCAAGIGAPHIRQRLYWMAHAAGAGHERWPGEAGAPRGAAWLEPQRFRDAGLMDQSPDGGRPRIGDQSTHGEPLQASAAGVALGDTCRAGLAIRPLSDDGGRIIRLKGPAISETEPVCGFWSGADWIYCRDGKWRPVEPGTFPLAHGASSRVGRLRGYGNALVAPLAQAFIEAVMEVIP